MAYYAVQKGLRPGVYTTWSDCEAQIHGIKNSVYKKFTNREEAEAFIKADGYEKTANSVPAASALAPAEPYAFVDGSYNARTGVYGYGGFLCADGKKYVLHGHDNILEVASMRNVAGEIEGVRAAVLKAKELGLTELTVYYDYAGIEAWATGTWLAKNNSTLSYRAFILNCGINIHFEKVAAHTGIEGNEDADKIAKYSVGISLTKPQTEHVEQLIANGEKQPQIN